MAIRFSAANKPSNERHDKKQNDKRRESNGNDAQSVHRSEDVFQRKIPITIRLHPDTVAKFKATGKGWQSRISAILDRENP